MFDPRIRDHGFHQHNHAMNLADRDRRSGQNDESCSSNLCGDQQQVQFRANQDEENVGSDDSGFCSPPLWKNSPSPQRGPSQPLLSHHVYTTLSPKSRVQAITRGQRELMEMVRNLPESSYELSLKDLVEHQKMGTPPQASPLGEGLKGSNKPSLQQRGGVKVKRQGSKNMRRSGSFEIENKGLFLKMGFPFSLQSKKRNKFGSNGSGKVSPRFEGIKGGGGERDWWKKKFTGSSDSDSSRTSNNSGSSGTTGSSSTSGHNYGRSRTKNQFLSSCLPFFQFRRSKYAE